MSAAGDISDFAYKSLKVTDWGMKEYAIDQSYLKEGHLGKWDQELFADQIKDVYKDFGSTVDTKTLSLRKWGFYYYPKYCKDH